MTGSMNRRTPPEMANPSIKIRLTERPHRTEDNLQPDLTVTADLRQAICKWDDAPPSYCVTESGLY